jgi:hypothetical protein
MKRSSEHPGSGKPGNPTKRLKHPSSDVDRVWGWVLGKVWFLAILPWALVVWGGCASSPTDPKQIAKRKAERPVYFAGLSGEEQGLVDQGQIRVGMSTDTVYLAWGKPAQILKQGDASGEQTLWLYEGTTTDEYMWWNYREVVRADGTLYLDRFMDRNFNIRTYISAELIFENDALVRWRMLPRPPGDSYLAPQPPMFTPQMPAF